MALLLSVIMLFGCAKFNPDDFKTTASTFVLEKKGEFKILNLTDIQLYANNINSSVGIDARKTIDKLVEQEKPDLITVTGDIIDVFDDGSSLPIICEHLNSFGIPWAPVLGNHDGEHKDMDRNSIGSIFAQYSNCLFDVGTVDGHGNYLINIAEKDSLVYSLYMMDTHNYTTIDGVYSTKYYDGLHENQIQWFKDSVAATNTLAGKNVPSMTFFHIPVPEINDAYANWEASGFSEEIGFGVKKETSCPSVHNLGFFDVAKENGTTHMIFGHDHKNAFMTKYEGVWMGYGLKTGRGSYIDQSLNGGTVITINADNSVSIKNVDIVL